MIQSESTADLHAALAKAQGAMTAAAFNKQNPHFKNRYADLAAVIDAVRRPLTDNGLSFTQTTDYRDGYFVLVTVLRHASGQWISSVYPLPVGKTEQQTGSALTYARRYSLSCIAGIAADEDDDAEATRKGGNGKVPDSKITSEQLEELNELVVKTDSNLKRFCGVLGVATLDELPSSRFTEARGILEHNWELKVKAAAKKAAPGAGA